MEDQKNNRAAPPSLDIQQDELYKKGFVYAMQNLDKYNTTVSKEIVAGITTFLTMSYIIVVNPGILSDGAGMSFAGVLTATVLVSALSSILMGLYANLPFALAPGMGINAFFAFTLVKFGGVPWQTALGAVFISGLIFILLSLFKVRSLIVEAIPLSLRRAIAGGIGLFIAFIGFQNAGFIKHNPITCVSFGGFSPQVILFIVGLLLTVLLIIFKVKGALLIGIIFTTLISIPIGRCPLTGDLKELVLFNGPLFTMPDFTSVFMKMDLKAAFTFGMIAPIFTFLFTDLFDSLSTFVGISQVANMLDAKGQPRNVGKALLVDAISTTMSGISGTSSGTSYIESAAGVEQGGRTGLTAIVVGLLFLPFMFISNVAAAIPSYAAAPALIIVGVYMMAGVKNIKFSDFEEGFPAFLGLILIPLTYSITQGIIWGFLSYTIIKMVRGKFGDIHWMMYVISGFSILALIFMY